jgi:glycosyltransferase involved in cell wall biosynthesis
VTRHVLVSQTRFPEIDRDTGSQRVDMFIQWLRERDWSVTFLATENDGDLRHAHRLRQLGIPTYVGTEEAEGLAAATKFDLALLAFWHPASRLVPILRAVSPETHIVIDSVDVHFLRAARRSLQSAVQLDESFGAGLAFELNAYHAADAVLTVSSKEARLLGDFLGADRIHELPLAHTMRRSPVPFEDRRGIVFIGNFRHPPNGEAVEYLCRDVLPRLSPDLLAEHPVHIVGSRLSQHIASPGRGFPNVKMVGWTPSVIPYLENARVCVVPLLHGAGVKGKVIEAMMAGTPVVTTPIGAEGIDVRDGEHLLIGEGPGEVADSLTHLLTDRDQWQRIADSGYAKAAATHAPQPVAQRFEEILDRVMAARPRTAGAPGSQGNDYRETRAAIAATMQSITAPGANVLVVSHGDDALLACEGRRATHFPQSPEGGWAGYHPADSAAAIEHLETLRAAGSLYLVLPSSEFWWLHHYREFAGHMEAHYRRIYSDDHLMLFDLAPQPPPLNLYLHPADRRERVLVLGTHDPGRSAPPAGLLEELDRAERFEVKQHWRPAGAPAETVEAAGADWVLHVDDTAVLPSRFVDEFLGTAAALDVERAQPAHIMGPEAAPPATERLTGIVARTLGGATPLPVLAVRAGADREGPTALIDAVPIGLAGRIGSESDPRGYSDVHEVLVADGDGVRSAVRTSRDEDAPPRISVLIATHDRPALLEACLAGFCDQTLPASQFEVVVVDDGSRGPETERVLAGFMERLPLTWAAIDHAGRSAAKNLALLLARGDLVLFFDDDDAPAPDLLEEHLFAHERHPGEATAILGHTCWDPDLEVSPLMHYLTEVDRMLFAYGNFEPGEMIDWQGFWEGRVSSKRSLHLRHGMHDQRLEYSIDVELAWRLREQGLQVVYCPAARSVMSRPIGFEDFRRRYEAKGRAQAVIASLHDDPEVREYTKVEGAAERWAAARPKLPRLEERIGELEQSLNGRGNGSGDEDGAAAALAELHQCYREVFVAHNAKGIAELLGAISAPGAADSIANDGTRPAHEGNGKVAGEEPPELSIVMPVWSRTTELADMAARAIERVWEVARLSTEVIVIDNGSPVERPLPARVHRFPENRGVATAWNTGMQLAQAPLIAFLNSDCFVEPGWDEALREAATNGRRIAFPYTDHCDGEGFRQPDQAGTAGWCFMASLHILAEVGLFDESFSPAYGEDTDYWHRAWELGIELSPVPAARVTHARRSSVSEDDRADWLLLAHRYKYGWKHGVEPLRAPPYYNREIVEYHSAHTEPSRVPTP